MPSDNGVTSSNSTSLTSPDKHRRLNRRADRNRFVRVDVLARFLAEEILDPRLHQRHPRLAADENHFVDVARLLTPASSSAVRHGAIVRSTSASTSDSSFARVSFCTRCFGPALVGRDVRQIHFGLLARRQLDLRLFAGFLEPLHRERIAAQVHAVGLS